MVKTRKGNKRRKNKSIKNKSIKNKSIKNKVNKKKYHGGANVDNSIIIIGAGPTGLFTSIFIYLAEQHRSFNSEHQLQFSCYK